ncbi:hypothetical protein ACFVYA_18645 [Amycolatopsis sp. NPDC058278]|uniref:hypothetical protein n=1 Tax=Amycolatopsis sp. NPDC058278 TaxID=3346417 RepID=UPI0036D970E4
MLGAIGKGIDVSALKHAARLQGLVGNNSSDDLAGLEQFWLHAAGERPILTGLPRTHTQDAIKEKIKSPTVGGTCSSSA